jgi:hypothetical protein
MTSTRPLGAPRLKAAVLNLLDRRVAACRDAEGRYQAMMGVGGGILGSVDAAKTAAATERSARLEAEHIRDLVAKLEPAKR